MASTSQAAEPTRRDLQTARVAVQALRLSAMLVAGYEVLFQYYEARLTNANVPQGVLSVWMLAEFGVWLVGTLLLSAIPHGPEVRRPSPPATYADDLLQPPAPGTIPPAASPEGASVRVLNGIALALLLIFLAIHQGVLSYALEQRAALAYLAMRTMMLWLVGSQLLTFAAKLPGGDHLIRATAVVRWMLMAALALWLSGWTLMLLDAPLHLGLTAVGQGNLFLRYACSTAEWLLIAGSVGSFVVLGRFLRAQEEATLMAAPAHPLDCPAQSPTVQS